MSQNEGVSTALVPIADGFIHIDDTEDELTLHRRHE